MFVYEFKSAVTAYPNAQDEAGLNPSINVGWLMKYHPQMRKN